MKKIGFFVFTALICISVCACSSKSRNEPIAVSMNENLPECTSVQNDVSLDLSQSKYIGTTINVSKEKPYWGMLVTNNGNDEIQVDMGTEEHIVWVKPEQSVWIYYEPFFKEGSYEIGFSSKDALEMNGVVKFWLAAEKDSVIPNI